MQSGRFKRKHTMRISGKNPWIFNAILGEITLANNNMFDFKT